MAARSSASATGSIPRRDGLGARKRLRTDAPSAPQSSAASSSGLRHAYQPPRPASASAPASAPAPAPASTFPSSRAPANANPSAGASLQRLAPTPKNMMYAVPRRPAPTTAAHVSQQPVSPAPDYAASYSAPNPAHHPAPESVLDPAPDPALVFEPALPSARSESLAAADSGAPDHAVVNSNHESVDAALPEEASAAHRDGERTFPARCDVFTSF